MMCLRARTGRILWPDLACCCAVEIMPRYDPIDGINILIVFLHSVLFYRSLLGQEGEQAEITGINSKETVPMPSKGKILVINVIDDG